MSVYFIINIVTFLSAFIASLALKKYIRLQMRPLVKTLLFVTVPFIVWDIFAVMRGDWGFNSTYTFPFRVYGLPVEEILFFPTTAFACIVIYRAMVNVRGTLKPVAFLSQKWHTAIILGLAIIPGIIFNTRWYTMSSVIGFVITVFFIMISSATFFKNRTFWYSILLSYIPFFIINSLLTGLPVVTYNSSAIIGFRIGTIPLEDTLFNFLMLFWYIGIYIENDTITDDEFYPHK